MWIVTLLKVVSSDIHCGRDLLMEPSCLDFWIAFRDSARPPHFMMVQTILLEIL